MEKESKDKLVEVLLEEKRYKNAYKTSLKNFYFSLTNEDKEFWKSYFIESNLCIDHQITSSVTVGVFKIASSKAISKRTSYLYLKVDLVLSLYFTKRYKEASDIFYTMNYYFQNLIHEKYQYILEKQKLGKKECKDELIRFCNNMKKYHTEREFFYYYKLGCIYKDNGDNKKAIEYFYKASLYDSKDHYNYTNISDIYDKLKLTRNAIDALRLSINISSPYYAEKHINLTRLLIVAGRYSEAKEVVLVAIKYSGDIPECHMLLSLIYLLELNEDGYHKKILSMPEEQRKEAIVYSIDFCETIKQYNALKLLLYSNKRYLKSIYGSDLRKERDTFSGNVHSLDKEDIGKKLKTCFLLDFENEQLESLSNITKKDVNHINKNKTVIPGAEYCAYALIERSQYKLAIKYFYGMDKVNTEFTRIKTHTFCCEYLMGEKRKAINKLKNFSLLHQREALDTLTKYAIRVEDFNVAKYALLKLNELIPKNLEVKFLENIVYSISRKKNIKIAYDNFKKFLKVNSRSEVFYKKLSEYLSDIYYNTKYIGSFISHMHNVERKFISYIRHHNLLDDGHIGVIAFIKILISMASGIRAASASNYDEMLDKISVIKAIDIKFNPEDVYGQVEEISLNLILDKIFVLKDKGRQLVELERKYCYTKLRKNIKHSKKLEILYSEIKTLKKELSRIIFRHTRIFTYIKLENIKTNKILEKNHTASKASSKRIILAPNKEGFVFCPTKSLSTVNHRDKVKHSNSDINNSYLDIEVDDPINSTYDLLYYVRKGSRYVLDYKNSFIFVKSESSIPKQITDNYFWLYNFQEVKTESGVKEQNKREAQRESNIRYIDDYKIKANQTKLHDLSDLELLNNNVPKIRNVQRLHDTQRVSYYNWMENGASFTSEISRIYLEREKNYADSYFDKLSNEQDILYNEIMEDSTSDEKAEQISSDKLDVIYRDTIKAKHNQNIIFIKEHNGYAYYKKYESKNPYPLYFRIKLNAGAKFFDPIEIDPKLEELLFDVNRELKKYQEKTGIKDSFAFVSEIFLSPKGKYLAYGIDFTGTEAYNVRVIDLCTPHQQKEYTNTYSMLCNVNLCMHKSERREIVWSKDDSGFYYYDIGDEEIKFYNLKENLLHPIEILPGGCLCLEYSSSKKYGILLHNRDRGHLKCSESLCFIIDLSQNDEKSDEKLFLTIPPRDNIEYEIDCSEDYVYARINDINNNFRIIRTKINDIVAKNDYKKSLDIGPDLPVSLKITKLYESLSKVQWEEFVAPDLDLGYLYDFAITKQYLVLNYRDKNADEKVKIVRISDQSSKIINHQEIDYQNSLAKHKYTGGLAYDSSIESINNVCTIRGSVHSFEEDDIRINMAAMPNIGLEFRYNFNKNEIYTKFLRVKMLRAAGSPDPLDESNKEYYLELVKSNEGQNKTPEQCISGNKDNDELVRERIWASSREDPDVKIPISLVYKKSLFKGDGSNPLYLYAYGSYGYCVELNRNKYINSLLDRGFVYAIAHIRGGSELGHEWSISAKGETKIRTIHDYIDCAEYLISKNLTKRGNIVASGRSAGGMLVGSAVNLAPELFRAVIALVPAMDKITENCGEYGEYRNKHEYIKKLEYFPYDNINRKHYPAIFATTGLDDRRVPYGDPMKWVAKIREYNLSNNPVILRAYNNRGHFRVQDRFQDVKDFIEEYVFICKAFNIEIHRLNNSDYKLLSDCNDNVDGILEYIQEQEKARALIK